MKSSLRWLNAALILIAFVILTDLNVVWYRHPANNIPVLKYSLIGLTVILFLLATLMILSKRKK